LNILRRDLLFQILVLISYLLILTFYFLSSRLLFNHSFKNLLECSISQIFSELQRNLCLGCKRSSSWNFLIWTTPSWEQMFLFIVWMLTLSFQVQEFFWLFVLATIWEKIYPLNLKEILKTHGVDFQKKNFKIICERSFRIPCLFETKWP